MVCQWNCNSCEKGDPGTSEALPSLLQQLMEKCKAFFASRGIHGDKELVPRKENGIQMFVVGWKE